MATGDRPDFGETFDFAEVFRGEINSINKRRRKNGRDPIALEREPFETSDGTEPLRPKEDSNVLGISLSGGGVRSAAFCLGALQGLREADVLSKADYLSTVSGGGYIGASVSAGMTDDGGHFPFRSELSEDESPSLQHVRDYSNYLFPDGPADFLYNASIYLRGLVANAILVLLFLLTFAAITIVSKPKIGIGSEPNLLGVRIPDVFGFNHFVVTSYLLIALLVFVIGWGIQRSWKTSRAATDYPNGWTTFAGWFVFAVFFSAFCEFQPFVLDAMFAAKAGSFFASLVEVIKKMALFLAPVAAAVAFVARKFGEVVKSALESESLKSRIFGYAAKMAIYVAGAVVPILLWTLYLQLSYWGIWLDSGYAAPAWIAKAAEHLPNLTRFIWGDAKLAVAQLYIFAAIGCLVIISQLRPNANSLHPLYRDRLSKAFIFKPAKIVPEDPQTGVQPPLDPLPIKLSELSDELAPYHLINTALNVEGSKEVNRRGRNADFFILSRNFVGSRATKYVSTIDMETVMKGLDLGTAIAVSGAAVSSDMGAATIKPLSPTLALLNIRLAYWMRNPKEVHKKGHHWNPWANFYFLREMFGGLTENLRSVYLSDGGHIENLGIYELLRRRCKVIIAVDAEADPQMAFGSFNVLERYALIDLGVRIDLPWQQIADVSKATGKAIDETGDCKKETGPHVAIGEIGYPGGRGGILIYIKSSITGDENDYVFHYKKRYGAFPHETTLDQLFSEEQFEAYRALGFHAAHRFFDRRDKFAYREPQEYPCIVDDVKFLDKFFPPPPKADHCWPREHKTFSEWLVADRKAAAEAATRKAADVALAATRLATAVETAATTLTAKPARKR